MNTLRALGAGATLVLFGGLIKLGAADENVDYEPESVGTQWTQETERLMEDATKVDDLTGSVVRNGEGERLGTLSDLVIKLPSGEIEYAVVTSGGIMGIGGVDRLVPYAMLSKSTEDDEYRLDVGKDIWEEVSEFDREAMDELESEGFRDRIKETFGFEDESASRSDGGAARPTARDEGERENGPTSEEGDRVGQSDAGAREGDRVGQPDAGAREGDAGVAGELDADRHYLAMDVVGYDVVDNQDESIGRVSDFLVSEDEGKVTHVLLSIGGFLTIGDEVFAVSPDELEFDNEAEKVRLPVGKEAFSEDRSEGDENWFNRVFDL